LNKIKGACLKLYGWFEAASSSDLSAKISTSVTGALGQGMPVIILHAQVSARVREVRRL
jgi:hypothetical protein